jgi:hypothetical protein
VQVFLARSSSSYACPVLCARGSGESTAGATLAKLSASRARLANDYPYPAFWSLDPGAIEHEGGRHGSRTLTQSR